MGASTSSRNGQSGSYFGPSCDNGQCGGAKKSKSSSKLKPTKQKKIKSKVTKSKKTKRKTTMKKSSKKLKKLIKHGNHSHRNMRTLHSCENKK